MWGSRADMDFCHTKSSHAGENLYPKFTSAGQASCAKDMSSFSPSAEADISHCTNPRSVVAYRLFSPTHIILYTTPSFERTIGLSLPIPFLVL